MDLEYNPLGEPVYEDNFQIGYIYPDGNFNIMGLDDLFYSIDYDNVKEYQDFSVIRNNKILLEDYSFLQFKIIISKGEESILLDETLLKKGFSGNAAVDPLIREIYYRFSESVISWPETGIPAPDYIFHIGGIGELVIDPTEKELIFEREFIYKGYYLFKKERFQEKRFKPVVKMKGDPRLAVFEEFLSDIDILDEN